VNTASNAALNFASWSRISYRNRCACSSRSSPRALTITFRLRVPERLRANIRGKRLDIALARITGAVQGVVPAVFPWADRMTVESSWDYRWREPEPETITLPATAENTVSGPATAAEEAALTGGVDAQP